MNNNRKRVSGRLEDTPRGWAIVTDDGDLWVLEDCDADGAVAGRFVTAEGTLSGLDRLKVEWLGRVQSS